MDAADDVYLGKVVSKDHKYYVLHNAVVLDWYGVDARLEAVWAPEDLKIGDMVHFTVQESGSFLIVNWVEKEAKSVRSEPTAKKPKSAANATSAAGGGGGGGRGGGGGGGDGGGEWWWWWW